MKEDDKWIDEVFREVKEKELQDICDGKYN